MTLESRIAKLEGARGGDRLIIVRRDTETPERLAEIDAEIAAARAAGRDVLVVHLEHVAAPVDAAHLGPLDAPEGT